MFRKRRQATGDRSLKCRYRLTRMILMRFATILWACTILLVEAAMLYAQPASGTMTRSFVLSAPAPWGWEQFGTRQVLRAARAVPGAEWSESGALNSVGGVRSPGEVVADAWTGAGWGFVVGAGVSGGIMFITCRSTYDCPVYIMTLAAGAVGGVVGAAFGALIGSSE